MRIPLPSDYDARKLLAIGLGAVAVVIGAAEANSNSVSVFDVAGEAKGQTCGVVEQGEGWFTVANGSGIDTSKKLEVTRNDGSVVKFEGGLNQLTQEGEGAFVGMRLCGERIVGK